MSAVKISFFAVFLLFITTAPPAAARTGKFDCYGVRTAPDVSEATCPHGVVPGWCPGVFECGKGPGQACGGRHNRYGRCGTGMFCGCGVCNGCDRKLDCFFQPKC